MKLRHSLISMTAIAVVSETMLAPFYPQLFADTFGVTQPGHIGIYLAATCCTVMLALPFWAFLAKKIPTPKLLVYTQFAAGLLSIGCFLSTNLVGFWLVSLSMLVFKGSYLLVYPYMLTTEPKDRHASTIGLLSVIVHLCDITGAILGGLVLQVFAARYAFLVMGAGDFIQMVLCFLLVRKGIPRTQEEADSRDDGQSSPSPIPIKNFVHKLGLVMFVFYFSSFLIRPFFARYWQEISRFDSKIAAGFVFAIPGIVALLALHLGKRKATGTYGGLTSGLLLGACGLLLQASQQEIAVLIGRCIFGWGLFQSTVRLDVVLFAQSTPESYAADFSKINFWQQSGALISFFTAGSIVTHGLQVPLTVAAVGFVVTLGLYHWLFSANAGTTKGIMATS